MHGVVSIKAINMKFCSFTTNKTSINSKRNNDNGAKQGGCGMK